MQRSLPACLTLSVNSLHSTRIEVRVAWLLAHTWHTKRSLEKLLLGGSTNGLESRVVVASSDAPCPERLCPSRSNVPDVSNDLECRRRASGVDVAGSITNTGLTNQQATVNNTGLTNQQATVLDRLRRFSSGPSFSQYEVAANGGGAGSIGNVGYIKGANGNGGGAIDDRGEDSGKRQRGDHERNGGKGRETMLSTAFSTRPPPIIMSHPAGPSRGGSRVLEDEPIYYAASENAEAGGERETRVGAVAVPSLDLNMLRFASICCLPQSTLLSYSVSTASVSGVT